MPSPRPGFLCELMAGVSIAQRFEQRSVPMDDQPRGNRVPPHSIETEQALLGVMLLWREAIADAAELLEAEHFYRPNHQHVYEAMLGLYAAGVEVDVVTVGDALEKKGLLHALGGSSFLIDLQSAAPAVTGAANYASIIRSHAAMRSLGVAANEIAEISFSGSDPAVALNEAEQLIYDVSEGRSKTTAANMSEMLDAGLDHLEKLYDSSGVTNGTATGFADLDDLLGGLQPSALYVVGARPAMGKTAFALTLAAHAAIKEGKTTLIFSLEMGQLELTSRLLASESRVDAKRMRDGNLSDGDWKKISDGVSRLSAAPIWVDDNPSLTVLDIRGRARRVKSRQGELGLVIVDYLQLMSGGARSESRQLEISEISRNLKILARELEVPVVALSQLSRGVESRMDKRPMLSDLRECVIGESLVMRPDGSRVRVDELEVGTEIAAIRSDTSEPMWASVSGRWSTGQKPTFKVSTESGASVVATGNHPFLTREGFKPVADLIVGDEVAETLTASDIAAGVVFWEKIRSIVPAGEREVFDLTVPATGAFFCNGVAVHNSGAIEQDADVVMFLYRDEVYNPDSPDSGIAEVIVAKHRNGPNDVVRLAFLPQFTRFSSFARTPGT